VDFLLVPQPEDDIGQNANEDGHKDEQPGHWPIKQVTLRVIFLVEHRLLLLLCDDRLRAPSQALQVGNYSHHLAVWLYSDKFLGQIINN